MTETLRTTALSSPQEAIPQPQFSREETLRKLLPYDYEYAQESGLI